MLPCERVQVSNHYEPITKSVRSFDDVVLMLLIF